MKIQKNIQYLRVIACLGVFATHLGQRLELPEGILNNFTHFGANGVYLFFIISGYLGFLTYKENESFGKYWVKRLCRIIPVYYALIIYDILFYTFVMRQVPPETFGLGWGRYFLFLNYSLPGAEFWRNLSFTWTISIFILFYLLMPLLKKCIKSYRASLIALVLFYIVSQVHDNSNEWFTPLAYLYFFFVGIVIYYAVKEKKEAITCLIFMLMAMALLLNYKTTATTYACLFTVLILVTMNMEIKNKIFDKVITTIDSYSFIIYLVHAVVMEGISIVSNIYHFPTIVVLLFAIITTAILSVIVRYLIDIPSTKLAHKLLGKLS